MADPTEPAEPTPANPPALLPRMVLVIAAAVCCGAAVGVFLYAPAMTAGSKPKRAPRTEEWTGPAAVKPVERGGEKPAEDKDPPPGEKKPDPPADPNPNPGLPYRKFDGLQPPTGGTFQAKRDEERTVVRLSNLRRVFGDAAADDLEVDFEVLRTGIVIAKDAVMVKTKDGTAKYEGSAPGKQGTLKIKGGVPGRYVGPVEIWIVLRRNGEDLISNTVALK